MKRIITASVVAALAVTSVQAESLSDRLSSLEAELTTVKKKLKKQNKKINEVKAHDSGDNIKWGVDLRTSIDNINYDMADGSDRGKNDLMATRLWLNMAYAPNRNNVFKGQLAYNKAWGADLGQYPGSDDTSPALNPFGMRGMGYDTFDWLTNNSLDNGDLEVRQAYWLYLGESAFGLDMPWTFSLGRRPSTGGFLANLRNDDAAQSPLGHIINVEFDGLSSKLDLSKVTGVPGMSFKLCAGQGATSATPTLGRLDATAYSAGDDYEDIKLAGFIFEPYNDGQFIVKTTAFRAFDLPGFNNENFFTAFGMTATSPADAYMTQVGDMDGAALSVLVDGITEEGYFADVKVFGSYAWSKTRPDAGQQMLGVTTGLGVLGAEAGESKSGHSYWFGAQLPVTVDDENYGVVGLEYNHGSEYWRPFDYAEDTMIGSKLAARGDAWEAYYTYQISEALSMQLRYTSIDYDYAGSNGFFASGGTPIKVDDVKDALAGYNQLVDMTGSTDPAVLAGALVAGGMAPDAATAAQMVGGMQLYSGFASSIVDKAQDFRFYLRYRF